MHEEPDVLLGPKRSLRELRGHLWIAKLRRQPCFNQIVKKLIDGQGVAAVARWCHGLNPEGELHGIAPETWRKYLTALAMRIKSDSKGVKRVKVEPLAYEALMGEVKRLQEAIADEPVANPGRPIWSVVKKAARELDAETMLKYCFMIQLRRVNAMLELEKKMNLLMPSGYKEIAALRKIAAEVRKYELGKQWIKGQKTILADHQSSNSTPPHGQRDEPFPTGQHFN